MAIKNNTSDLNILLEKIKIWVEKPSDHILQSKTIIPSSLDQTISPDGEYDGLSEVTITGDENLKPENIKNGTTIFGVSGIYTDKYMESLIARTLTKYSNDTLETIGHYAFGRCFSLISVNFPTCTSIGHGAFWDCRSLTSISFPACTSIGSYTFYYCNSLTSVSFPKCTRIGGTAFYRCTSLTSVSFPACTYIDASAFYECISLTSVNFPVCITIGSSAFYSCRSFIVASFPICTKINNNAFNKCYNLTSLYLTGATLCNLSNSNAFTSTPIGGYSASAGCYGSIYVPSALLSKYQSATNWTYFSSRFVAYDIDIGDNNGLITFTIEDILYQAEEGMTWEQWINSEYNTDGYYLTGGYVYNGEKYVWHGDKIYAYAESGNNVISTNDYYLDSRSSVFG